MCRTQLGAVYAVGRGIVWHNTWSCAPITSTERTFARCRACGGACTSPRCRPAFCAGIGEGGASARAGRRKSSTPSTLPVDTRQTGAFEWRPVGSPGRGAQQEAGLCQARMAQPSACGARKPVRCWVTLCSVTSSEGRRNALTRHQIDPRCCTSERGAKTSPPVLANR